MQEEILLCSYLSRKMSKVRWKPDSELPCSKFLTGSWGEPSKPLPNIKEPQGNAVQLWKYVPNTDPIELCYMEHSGDVSELTFIDDSSFLVSSSEGSLQLGKVVNDKDETSFKFQSLNSWNNIHTYKNGTPSALTSFARSKNGVVTVGDDGRLAIISLDAPLPVCSIEDADSCSIKCVSFVDHKSVITGNSIGNLKVWDLSTKPKPQLSLPNSLKLVSITLIKQKPSQNHLVFTGSDDGCLTVWDMRNTASPVILNSGHAVNELQFHPENPNHFFTCNAEGGLLHWNTTQDPLMSLSHPWAAAATTEGLNERLDVETLASAQLYSRNSLDVCNNSIISCCDNESLFIHKNPIGV